MTVQAKTISGSKLYLAPIEEKPTHKIEITQDGWKLVGYIKDLEIKRKREVEEEYSWYAYDSFPVIKSENIILNAQFTTGPGWNHMYEIITGLPVPERPVERLKRLLHG